MLKLAESFAGVTPHNKALAADENMLYYISSSNMIASDGVSISRIHHFDNQLSCIAAHAGVIALGDVAGNCIILESDGSTRTLALDAKVIDCCFVGDLYVVFCTLNSIFILNPKSDSRSSLSLTNMITSVTSIDGNILVGTNLGALQLYSLEDGSVTLIEDISAHTDSIRCIRVDGTRIITGSQDTNVKTWVYQEGRIYPTQTLRSVHSDWINGVWSSRDTMYTASSDKMVYVWEWNDQDYYCCVDVIPLVSEALSVVMINERVFIQTKSGGIDEVDDMTCRYLTSGHLAEVTDIDWNNNLLVSCSLDKTTRLFYTGNECGRAQIHGFPMTSVKFLPGPRLRFISAGQETILRIFEATQAFFETCKDVRDNTERYGETRSKYLCKGEVEFLCEYLNTEDYVKSAYPAELNLTNEIGTEVSTYALSDNQLSSSVFKECKKIYGHYFEVKNIAVGSELILTCNRSALKKFAGLFVWSLEGEKLQYIEEHDLDIQRIAISSDQAYAVTVGRDHLVCLYRISNRTLDVVERFTAHKRIVWDCGFSRDSEHFASCSRDGDIVMYSTKHKSIEKTVNLGTEITTLAFSPKSDLLAAGTADGMLLILDYELNVLDRIQAVSKRVNIARFDPTGMKIAVGGSDGLIRVIQYCQETPYV